MSSKWLSGGDSVTFEEQDGIAVVTLNRPEKRNALDRALLDGLRLAMLEADDRKSVRCVVLRAAGDHFSAGYDLATNYNSGDTGDAGGYDPTLYRSARESYDDDLWRVERNQADILQIFDIHKPVIAEVQGNCLAGGTDIALMCDMVLVADDASIGYPATRGLGSPPSHVWTYLVGPQWAKRLLLTGDLISGRDAEKIGLVLEAVPRAELHAEAMKLASRLALVDADVLACNKRIVNLSLELMGMRSLQRLASENDVRGHQAASAKAFGSRMADAGLRVAVKERDGPFGDGRVHLRPGN